MTNPDGVSPPAGAPPPPLDRLVEWAPLAGAAVYLVALLVHVRTLLTGVLWSSDVASVPVMAADLLHHRGVATVSIATYYSTFLWDFATSILPFHRTAAASFSLGCSLLAAAVVAWCAARVAGRAAGVVTLAIAVAVSPHVLYVDAGQRGPTWLALALLCGVLVFIARPPARPVGAWRSRAQWVTVVVVGAITGVSVASDPLLVVCGVIPFLVAGLAAWLLAGRSGDGARVGTAVLATSGVGAVIAATTYALGPLAGFRIVPTTIIKAATLSTVGPNLRTLGHDVLAFGDAYPARTHFPGSLAPVLPVAMVLGAVGAAAVGSIRLRRRLASAATPESTGMLCFLVFWVTSALATMVAFAGSNLAVADVASIRYVVPVVYALAACLGLWGAGPWLARLGVAALACVLCAVGASGTGVVASTIPGAAIIRAQPALSSFLAARGLTRGYAGYWDSLGFTWTNQAHIGLYPVMDCGPPGRQYLCRFYVNTMSTWYAGGPGRTFVLSGPPMRFGEGLALPPIAPPELGPPAEKDVVGPYTIFIYDRDIGPSLPPWRPS